ncbi:thioredoxin [Medicago truncatula]|uniref:Thioredoxin n=1 Tax=Medicago truncatula TaxID=3880 RepID=A0A072TJU1_MEDTR|nr:thioredoxin [Medicago truncatula]KEH17817.1 thioredoxin [Medicago truncatula]
MQNVTTISPKCASIHSSRHASPHIQDIPCITVGTRHQRDTPTDHHCPQILITLLFCQLSKLMDFFSVHPHYCLFPLSQSQTKDDDSVQHVEFASGNVQLITTKESWNQTLEQARGDRKIVIANFSARWCSPCKIIAPYYCELSEKYPSIMFLVIDVDELTDFSTSWDIKATPTFFFLRDGQEIDKLVGANKPELEKKIAAVNLVPRYQ